jgi:hypothetical protein
MDIILKMLLHCRSKSFTATGYKKYVYNEAIQRLYIDISSSDFSIDWFINHLENMKFDRSIDTQRYYDNVNRIALRIAMLLKDRNSLLSIKDFLHIEMQKTKSDIRD